ncbi:hypothetical protein WOLCODRAFT_139833 [Wolfiporia cocos MD-104 SS10]|uniref:Uncharacterized protein n=1 Tax=Wolfiporia cocos (strain MD-104) TaxID=742152 RepID=A0A2H3IZ40_WOLCO|nr:hypothetical protein WOLCODRAFT_139833 [Wolfiporia cocos MD-104 SS10]
MSAVVRSFVVFRDDPFAPTEGTLADYPVPVATARPPRGPALVFNPDKENINPFTGLRANTEHCASKKRKTGVLATKAHAAPPSKKARESREKAAPAPKAAKRSDAPTAAKGKGRSAAEKKSTRVLGTKRNGPAPSSRARRSPSLPPIVEVAGVLEAAREEERIAQALIDSRCYELTVMPLADVSEAYEVPPRVDDDAHLGAPEKAGDDVVAAEDKEQLAKPAVDNERASSPAPSLSPLTPPSTPGRTTVTPSLLSTPERKRIYSSFTFSSPSPSGERYAAKRASSVERFSDVSHEL